MDISVSQIAQTTILAGATFGRSVLGELISEVGPEPKEPELVFLDFSDIEVATASFLRESVVAFKDRVRGQRSTLYPVVTNPNESVRDELQEITTSRGGALMCCERNSDGMITDFFTIGQLDPKQQLTFDLVHQEGVTDAGALMERHGKDEGLKHATAWNNRLASLSLLGLIVELREGRAKRYKPLFTSGEAYGS